VTANGNRLALSDSAGMLQFGWNLFKPGFVYSHSGVTGVVTDLGGNVTAESPSFVGELNQDYHLTALSAARNASGPLPSDVAAYPLNQEYLKHQASRSRPVDAELDIGAFEYQPMLSILVSGSGSGIVTSSPGGIACGLQCSSYFPLGSNILLSATPDAGGSLFSGWGGSADCSYGVILLDSDMTCTATFDLCPGKPASVGGVTYDLIQDACTNASSVDTILLTAVNHQEDVELASGKTIKLEGGYDCGFGARVSQTTITGSVMISSGTVTVDRIVLR
jgi:hypothetical protein